jgi:ankyrin repeat protein
MAPIHIAARNGNIESLKRFLNQGENVNQHNLDSHVHGIYYARTPLQLAASTGKIEAVRLLLNRGATVNRRDLWNDKTALMDATESGHLPIVRLLLDRGANVNTRDPEERTPLHFAIISGGGHLPVVRLLLERGANVNARDEEGQTPLMYAAKHVQEKMMRLLLQYGANINARDNEGKTPLIVYASQIGSFSPYVKELLKKGANINGINNNSEITNKIKKQILETNAALKILRKYRPYIKKKHMNQNVSKALTIYTKAKPNNKNKPSGFPNKFPISALVKSLKNLHKTPLRRS